MSTVTELLSLAILLVAWAALWRAKVNADRREWGNVVLMFGSFLSGMFTLLAMRL